MVQPGQVSNNVGQLFVGYVAERKRPVVALVVGSGSLRLLGGFTNEDSMATFLTTLRDGGNVLYSFEKEGINPLDEQAATGETSETQG